MACWGRQAQATALLKLVMGWLHPDEGQISILGSSHPAAILEAHDSIGYIPNTQFHNNFTGWEDLRLQARLCGLKCAQERESRSRSGRLDAASAGLIMRRIGYYTAEMLQRLALGVALVGAGNSYPALLVLINPRTGWTGQDNRPCASLA